MAAPPPYELALPEATDEVLLVLGLVDGRGPVLSSKKQ
jgi:hypothetical protein